MATIQKTTPTSNNAARPGAAGTLFTKENHKWMMIGGGILILGFLLMIGGNSKDPNQFDPKEVYSTLRVTIAPLLVLAGLGTLVYAIMKKG